MFCNDFDNYLNIPVGEIASPVYEEYCQKIDIALSKYRYKDTPRHIGRYHIVSWSNWAENESGDRTTIGLFRIIRYDGKLVIRRKKYIQFRDHYQTTFLCGVEFTPEEIEEHIINVLLLLNP